ncbi:phosphonate ABC transporter ATP-binding protein [Halostella salina]|uniref:phosphonate ABC transporter ATP-binding protein n=1 Tax=Halostella salina TaxID=1547897 RepID=UPI000EF7B41F|nr:phosphonate ABC transporter ATP-binding protein [Halostella salina]
MGTIRVENLSKSYGDVQAIDDVSFSVDDGEFVILLGTSGAGKSTLLRCLNGLTSPTDGRITIDGEEVVGQRNDVAMVFQQHNIIEQMSAYSNALSGSLNRTGFLRSLFQWNDHEDKLEALRALETVGLLEESGQRADSMSGGQQQRVGIARALVQQPTTLLADEPVASLDPASAETVMGYLRTAADERDITTVASLHQVNIAREFGDRFIGLKEGEKVFDGDLDDLTIDAVDRIYGKETSITRENDSEEAVA